jgi:hypothetical protein
MLRRSSQSFRFLSRKNLDLYGFIRLPQNGFDVSSAERLRSAGRRLN